jgi:hypothetical protein
VREVFDMLGLQIAVQVEAVWGRAPYHPQLRSKVLHEEADGGVLQAVVDPSTLHRIRRGCLSAKHVPSIRHLP